MSLFNALKEISGEAFWERARRERLLEIAGLPSECQHEFQNPEYGPWVHCKKCGTQKELTQEELRKYLRR
jgi:hypothetical protein